MKRLKLVIFGLCCWTASLLSLAGCVPTPPSGAPIFMPVPRPLPVPAITRENAHEPL